MSREQNTTVVGKSVPRVDAKEKVTGQATYCFDYNLPNMLVGKILRSPHPHAKIINIDTSKAEALPGVKAVITAQDTTKIKFGSNEYFFPYTVDQTPLAVDKVRYIGDDIAAVAAVDEETAQKALLLIDVKYEVLPAVFDAEEAMKPGAPAIHNRMNNISVMIPVNFGDVDKAFTEADYVREDVFRLQSASHCTLEPHVCVASFELANNKLTLWTSTQAPFRVRENLAKTLEMKEADIRVIKLHVGGGFGAKLELLPLDFCASLLSKKSRQPVKITYSRQEVFSCGRRKHPMIYKLKSGVKKDGTLLCIQGEVIADGGAYCSYGPTILAAAIMRIFMVYKLTNIRMTGYRIYTNNPISGAMRGFGGVQSGFAIESHMDMLAEGIGMDPIEFRLKNTTGPNMTTINKMIITSNGLKECIEKVREASNWAKKFGKQKDKCRGIGIGIAADVMGSKMYKSHESAGAFIKVEEDGSVLLFTGAADTGQGSDTALSQIAAEELGVKFERIRIIAADTEITPFDTGSFASRVTFISGNAAKNAATDVKSQMLDVVSRDLKIEKGGLDIIDEKIIDKKQDMVFMNFDEAIKLCYSFGYGHLLLGRGNFNPQTTPIDFRTSEGNVSGSYGFEAQMIEVEVDIETGRVKIIKIYDAHDVGKAINPMGLEGQIEGSIVLGIGYTFYEDLIIRNGKVLNANFSKYRIPRANGIPHIETIIVETNDPKGPFGAKGMGEASLLPTSAAIANAIYDAVGVRIKELPITPEKLLRVIKEKQTQ